MKFVGFWKRTLISIIDLVIYILYILLIGILLNQIIKIKEGSDLFYLLHAIIEFIVPIIFLFFLWKYKGASIGKLIFKTKIVDIKNGERPSDKKLFIRIISSLLTIIAFPISFIHIALDSRKQSWHDKIAGTSVVKCEKNINNKKFRENISSTKRDNILFRVEVTVFLILFIAFMLFLFFLLYDEPLNPIANNWIRTKMTYEKNPEKNGFYFIAGLSCDKNSNPFEVGYEWVQNQNKKITTKSKNDTIINDLVTTNKGTKKIKKKSNKKVIFGLNKNLGIIADNFNIIDKDETIGDYYKKRTLIDSLCKKYDFLLKRYDKINHFSYIQNTIIPSTKTSPPILMGLVSLKRLKLVWIAKEYKLGNRKIALKELQKEIELSRFLAKEFNTVIGKMLSGILMDLDLSLLSKLIDESNPQGLKNLIPPYLTSQERNWKDVTLRLFNEKYNLLNEIINSAYSDKKFGGKIDKLLFDVELRIKLKKNKFINRHIKFYQCLNDISTLDTYEFNLKIKEFSREEDSDFESKSFKHIFDLTGFLLSDLFCTKYLGYITKFHDIDGYINMLKVKSLIYKKNVPTEDIPDFLVSVSDSLNNPYTKKSFLWNPLNKTIYYKGPFQSDNSILREIKLNLINTQNNITTHGN